MTTARGDTVVVTLFSRPGEQSTILVSVDDADGTPIPTVELTLPEAAKLRSLLRYGALRS